MFAIEYIIPLVLAMFFLLSNFFPKRFIIFAIGAASVVQILVLSFRPDDYNSDTFNYSKYIELITSTDGFGIFAASKFEPLHLVLASVAQDFRLWLIFESVLCAALIIGIIRRIQRLESVAIIFGSAAPLFSSSMRFSLGLMVVAYAMLALPKMRGRLVIVSLIGLVSHASLVISGFLQRGRLWQILTLLAFILAYTANDIEILERAGGGEDNASGGTGLRAFLTLIVFLMIVYFRRSGYDLKSFRNDILVATSVLLMTIFLYPVFNRFIVLLLVIKSIQFDYIDDKFRGRRIQSEGLSATLLYILLVSPFLISMTQKVAAGDW